jgi:hypothetical protein
MLANVTVTTSNSLGTAERTLGAPVVPIQGPATSPTASR